MRSTIATTSTLLAVLALVVTAACTPKPTAADPLPPAGLAGAPGSATTASSTGSSTHATPQPSAALTTLPGMGHDVPAPTGGVENAQLPPGHPPIDTAPTQPLTGAATGAPGAPMGAGASGAQDIQITGTVLEALNVPSYTYMRIKTSSGEEWAAVNTAQVAVGDTVTVSSQLEMENFNSKSLNRTFPRLVMGMLVGAPKKP